MLSKLWWSDAPLVVAEMRASPADVRANSIALDPTYLGISPMASLDPLALYERFTRLGSRF